MEERQGRSKRRLFQYSLRSLFVFMLLAAVLCGTVGVRAVYVRDQRALAERLSGVAAQTRNVSGGSSIQVTVTWEEMPSYLGMRPQNWVRGLLGDDFYSNVVEISLQYNRQLTDDDLEMISRLDDLRRLDLSLTPISDAGLRYLGELPRLESLDLGSTEIGDEGLGYLDGAPELVAVRLTFTGVSDEGIVHLAETHPRLRRIDLTSTATSDASLAALAACKDLDTLVVCDTDVTSAGIAALAGSQHLRVVALNNTSVDDEAMGALAQLPALEELYLRNAALSDKGIEALADAPKLRLLQICGTEVTDAGVAQLAHIETLKVLDLRGLNVSDAGILPLKDLDLDLLLVQNTSVTSTGLARLANLPEELEKVLIQELSKPVEYVRILVIRDRSGVVSRSRAGTFNLVGKPIPFPRLELVSPSELGLLRQVPSKSLSPAQRELLDSTDDARLSENFSID